MKQGILLLLLLSSFLFWSLTFEQFETPKSWALITFACFAALHVNWKQILKDKIEAALCLFIVSVAVSTLFSIDRRMSFWGNSKCPNGFLVNLSYLVLYLAIPPDDAFKKQLKRAILFCGSVVSLYSISQVFGIDFMTWHGVVKEGKFVRPPGTMGHPNFTAAYLAMILPFAMADKKRAGKVLSALIMAAIVFSQSRGMWLATACGVLTYGLTAKASYKRFLKGFGAIVGMVLLVALFFPSFRYGAAYRAKGIFSPGAARLEYPAAALRTWKKYPFLGSGTDTFETTFQHERTVRYWEVEPTGSPTRAHCEFLNILSTQGLFGALSVILLTMAVIFRLRKIPDPAIAGAITAFYVGNISSFTVISTGILFMVCLALLKESGDEILIR